MKKEPSIRLHPEHGLNPTMSQCAFCGEDKGEIALLGAAYPGKAPMHMVVDVHPCDRCQKLLDEGKVGLLEVELKDGAERTATHAKSSQVKKVFAGAIISEENYRQAFGLEPPKEHITFCERGVFQKIGLAQAIAQLN